jgi:DNA-directed RNA polymerase specialized sigma subunit
MAKKIYTGTSKERNVIAVFLSRSARREEKNERRQDTLEMLLGSERRSTGERDLEEGVLDKVIHDQVLKKIQLQVPLRERVALLGTKSHGEMEKDVSRRLDVSRPRVGQLTRQGIDRVIFLIGSKFKREAHEE